MNKKPFKSTELKEFKKAAFVNGDDAAGSKVLTDRKVSQNALRAVFRDRPSYFLSNEKSVVR